MNMQLIKMLLLASVIAFAGCNKQEESAAPKTTAEPEQTAMAEETPAAEAQEKPSIYEESISTLEATVTAIDQDTREVTLEDAEGESITIIAGEEVRNLAQVEVGDKVMLEYLEAISIDVFAADEIEVGAEVVSGAARAEPGEKPAGAAMSETTVVVEIVAIDKENEQVTLKGPQGNTKTVQVRNPDNLNKVVIGDKVMITYTEAMAVKVTEIE